MRRGPDNRPLPRGMIYDPARRRFRVRLYRKHREIWLSYAHDYLEALKQYQKAKACQARIRSHEGAITGLDGYIAAIQEKLV